MRSLGVIAVLLCAGCSLEQGGLAPTLDDAGTKDVTSIDVTVDAPPDVSTDAGLDVIEEPGPPLPCSTDASVCTGAIPGGWTLTLFSANRATSCPSNSVTTDVVSAPVANAGACTCSCNITQQPSCAIGAVTGKWANDNQCGNNWNTWNITTPGQCVDYGMGSFNLGSYNSYSKLPLTPGKCTGAAVTDTNKLASTAMRTCAPAAACAEDVCNGQVPSGFRACIATAGDVPACPAGPFSVKAAVIGPSATLTCDACSACNVTQSACGNGTVKYWADAACTMARGSIAADGNCNSTGTPNVNHFTYESPVTNVQCVAGTSTAKVDLSTKQTICCRP